MTDLALFHVKTVRDGEADFTDHTQHSFVIFDGKKFYYDFTGLNVTKDQFHDFIECAWGGDDDLEITVEVYDQDLNTFKAWAD